MISDNALILFNILVQKQIVYKMIKIERKKWMPIAIWCFLLTFIFNMANYHQPAYFALLDAIYEVLGISLMYYFISLYLFPKYYGNNKKYINISIVLILFSAFALLIMDINILRRFSGKHIESPPVFFHFFRYLMSMGFTFFVATSVSLMERNNQLKEREKLLKEEKLATELKLLKTQINPHFIFNALNNIYSLSYMQSKNAPDSILKLSEMLRYVFYDCSKDRVPISAELKYIENFTAFQQMKSEYIQNIKLESVLTGNNIEIAPMLFIPLIENAFKYSRIEEDEQSKVVISLKQNGEKIHFKLVNNVPDGLPKQGSGMGIKNVKHRLDIIYPNRYLLNIDNDNKLFVVDLTLEV